jgi:hypothetical protein
MHSWSWLSLPLNVCTYIHIWFPLNNLCSPQAILKFIPKVSDHKRKAKFNSLFPFWCCVPDSIRGGNSSPITTKSHMDTFFNFFSNKIQSLLSGADPGGCTQCVPPPLLKLEKMWFFGIKSLFFTRNTPTIFAPPSARCNFFNCAPLTWNPVSAPGYCVWFFQLLYKVFLKSKNEGSEGESNASADGNHDNSEANNNTSEVLKPSQKQNTTADSNHGNKDITQTYRDTVNKYYLEYIEQSVSIFYVLLCDLYPWCANQG